MHLWRYVPALCSLAQLHVSPCLRHLADVIHTGLQCQGPASVQLTVQAACPQLPLSAGPGAFDFKQGDTNGTAFWRVVRNFLRVPSRDQEQCQLPKPILLDTGNVHLPYDWCVIRPCALLLAATLRTAAGQSWTQAVDVLPFVAFPSCRTACLEPAWPGSELP